MHFRRWLVGLFGSRLQAGFALAATAGLGGLGFLPLLGGPGYEFALATGLLLPGLVGCATAIDVARRRPEPLGAIGEGLARGAGYALLALVLALAHGARAGFCDPMGDLRLLVLGGAFGAVMGGAWGAVAGLVAAARRRRRLTIAILLALAGPLGGIALSLGRFYTSPMVFAYDPFFGVFAGPLYDTVVSGPERLLTYRLGSVLTLVATAVAATALRFDAAGRLVRRRPGPHALLAAGALAATASAVLAWYGPELGHYQSTRTIRRALGAQTWAGRCHVIYSRSIPSRDARLVADQCDVHLRQLADYFGVAGPDRCTVFLFASAAEKSHLMGAGRTQIAKPWRREIYIQGTGYPHRVLRHELAHVVAAEFGRGPFRVSGPLRGLIPDPGRIEGVAEAAAPRFDADLTATQWSRALSKLDLLPPLATIFRLSFIGENSSTAYTVAGAFVHWFRERFGTQALRRWYAGEDLAAITGGRGLSDLETDWHASLAPIQLSPQALAMARARFDRPAIFGRTCPRVVDRMAAEAGARLNSGDPAGAHRGYQALLRLDPNDVRSRLAIGDCAVRSGDDRRARRAWLEVAADDGVPDLQRAQARERVADADLRAGDIAAAQARYRRVAAVVLDEDHLRTLDLKLGVTDEVSRQAVVALLIGHARHGANWATAAARLGEWAGRAPHDGTPSYLLGRNLMNQGHWDEAAPYLDRALELSIPSVRLRREAAKLRVVVACARGNLGRAREAWARYLTEPPDTPARRDGARRFAELCGIATR